AEGSACNEGPKTDQFATAVVAVCCVTPAASHQAASIVEVTRGIYEIRDNPGSADSLIFSSHVMSLADMYRVLRFDDLFSRPLRADATQTYLITGRLRL
ncbi:MAG: hypothetical protein ACREXP_11995, partial [Steroidobacteraceae bacterium]